MAEISAARLLLIVTGSSCGPRRSIAPWPTTSASRSRTASPARAAEGGPYQVRVVSDLRWLHDETFQDRPTISVGGPGVNLLAHRWLEELPLSLAVEDQYFLQMDPDLDELKASIWGMDNPSTQIAVSAFVNRFLPRFLEHCLAASTDPIDLDEFD